MMTPKVGFSLGYLSGLKNARGVLDYVVNKGITNCRVYQPFVKGFDDDTDKIADRIEWLIKQVGFTEVLVSLSGCPHSWLQHHDLSGLTKTQFRASRYANRFAPYDYDIYEALITDLMTALISRGIYDKIIWEIGNEPNASRYFWGSLQEWDELADYVAGTLWPQPNPHWLCGFSSSLMRDATYKARMSWKDWIEMSSLYTHAGAGFSHSFYWQDSGGLFDVNDNSYPTRQFSDIIVSEYNVATSLPIGSVNEKMFNSPAYVTALFKFLKFMKGKPCSRIYLHTLVDYNRDSQGTMCLWKSKKHGYAPKEASKQFMKAWAVMDRGYEVQNDRIAGINQSIVFDENGNWEII